MTHRTLFPSRWRVTLTLGPFLVAIAFALSAAASGCRGCDIAGVFYFCSDEGPHEVVTSPPPAWRAAYADVQEQLAQFTRERYPDSTFTWRNPDSLVFVRVLGHGIPGAAARTAGDTLFFNPEVEGAIGILRHEAVHWVQPGNAWLQPLDGQGRRQIHWPPVFDYVHAPLLVYG